MKKKRIIRYVIICILALIVLYTNVSDSMTYDWISTLNWLGLIVTLPFFIHSISKKDGEYGYMAISFFTIYLYLSALGMYFDNKHNETMRIVFACCSSIASIAMFLWIVGVLKNVAKWIWGSVLFTPIKWISLAIGGLVIFIIGGLAEWKGKLPLSNDDQNDSDHD